MMKSAPVAKCFSLVIPRPVRRLFVGIRPPIQGKTDCHSPFRGFIPREGTRRAAAGACYFAMTGTGILQRAPCCARFAGVMLRFAPVLCGQSRVVLCLSGTVMVSLSGMIELGHAAEKLQRALFLI